MGCQVKAYHTESWDSCWLINSVRLSKGLHSHFLKWRYFFRSDINSKYMNLYCTLGNILLHPGRFLHRSLNRSQPDCSGCRKKLFSSHPSRFHQLIQYGLVKNVPAWVNVQNPTFNDPSWIHAPSYEWYHSFGMQNIRTSIVTMPCRETFVR